MMKSMALDDEEILDMKMPMATSDVPEYPWELRIALTDKTMAKLGIDPEEAIKGVGGMVAIHALARITSASINQREGDETCSRVELQIEEMSIDAESIEDVPKPRRSMASIYKT